MGRLSSPSTIADIKRMYDFRLSKSLGQNFITDPSVIEDIVDNSFITEDDLVIEIGPGIGVLTAAAAERAGRVVAIEIDKKLIPILKETLAGYDNIEVINSDILKTDLGSVIEEYGKDLKGVKIIGNLPYYITTPIIMKILEEGVPAESVTIMMQKEVAERISASPGGKTYGALSVTVGYYCDVEYIVEVPRHVFIPQPKVDSAVIRLDIRKEHPVELVDEKVFFETIKKSFSQRRKTLNNSLTGVRGLSKEEVYDVLEDCGIEGNRRAETLSIDEFAALANRIAGSAENDEA